MNARECMLAAFDRQVVDRIPTDIWATAETWKKLDGHFGSRQTVYDQLHIDGMAGVNAVYVGPEIIAPSDMWGIRTKPMAYADGIYHEQSFNPLAAARSIDDLEAYQWPQADWFDYSQMREIAVEKRKMQVLQCGYMAPFYMHNKLRGLEASLIDPHEDVAFTHHLLTRLSDFLYEHHRRMFEACDGLIDIAQVTDDLGSQAGPMISMETYHTFYASHHKRFIDLCKEFGIRVMHHDDGSIRAFLPDLVAMGIDVLNPVQWTCADMEMVELKRDFGAQICFHGAVDNQQILPFGSPEDVRAEVRHCIDALASDHTGYVLAPCHNIQANTSIENIVAMYDEAHLYGDMKR